MSPEPSGAIGVNQQIFISLLNPTLAVVLAAAFFVLWMFRRENRYVVQLSLCYVAVTAGFTLQGFDFGLGFELSKLLSNLLFFCALSLLATAVLSRQNLPVPVLQMGACVLVSVALLCWFLWVKPDFAARVFTVNYGLGALCVVALLRLRQAKRRTLMDRLIMLMTGVRAMEFFLRPPLVRLLDSHPGESPYISSAYWLSTSLATMIFSLLIALTLLTAVALDTIQELQAETQTDPLSKLLNRRGSQLLERCTAARMPVALVMADLDHFKAVNDNHGHAAGDRVIADFAEKLRLAAGSRGIIGRIGGEEFAVLLPLADLVAARLFAEAVRTLCAAGGIDGLPPGTRVTASFGVAARSEDEGLEALMRRADEALYQAKRNGRDGVRLSYQRSAEPPLRMPHGT